MTCPNCGREMDYIFEYDRYVCYDGPYITEEAKGCGYEEDASTRDRGTA